MILRFLAVLLALSPLATAQAAPSHIAVSIEAETLRPKPGARVTLALVMTPQRDWHGYWENPGDAGVPTSVEWTLPPRAAIGGLRHPVPSRLVVQGLMNYVYERPYALLATLTVPAGVKAGTPLRIEGKINWLACSPSICVPEHGVVAIDMVAGDGAIVPAARARFDRWRARLPLPLAQAARFARTGDRFRIAIPFPAGRPVSAPYFYPISEGVIDYAAPQAVSRNGDMLIVETKVAPGSAQPKALKGVIAIGAGRGLSLSAVPGSVPAAGTPVAEAGDGAPAGGGGIFLLALGGAILGGLLLNIMPCVFPILSLKALSLARTGDSGGRPRADALAYAGGVILSCVALGGALLALRAGGSAAGWAFQLQDPRMILLLLLLVTAISLNLAGLFELGTIGLGDKLTHGSGLAPAFWTGVLAAFVATPCTGPFMAGALGVALILPPIAAIAIFAGLGFGLALPFLALGFVPALRRMMPKPGAWMDRFRRILSIPMFVTAIGLAWILGRQAGVDGMALGLVAALLLGLALWWVGGRQAGGRRFAWGPAIPALLAVIALALVIPRVSAPAGAATATAEGSEPFSEARLATLTAQGKPVFLYFTADWCLTCKVNEKAAIERPEVEKAFATAGVAVMIGDWTDGDPAIGRFLEAQGRSGVPLYLFYHRDGRIEALPQLLTPATLTALVA